jgi:hypothetical protein
MIFELAIQKLVEILDIAFWVKFFIIIFKYNPALLKKQIEIQWISTDVLEWK